MGIQQPQEAEIQTVTWREVPPVTQAVEETITMVVVAVAVTLALVAGEDLYGPT